MIGYKMAKYMFNSCKTQWTKLNIRYGFIKHLLYSMHPECMINQRKKTPKIILLCPVKITHSSNNLGFFCSEMFSEKITCMLYLDGELFQRSKIKKNHVNFHAKKSASYYKEYVFREYTCGRQIWRRNDHNKSINFAVYLVNSTFYFY